MECIEERRGFLEVIKMLEIGRLCVKTAGRDGSLKCVVVEKIDEKYVLIDGETRRRKCNAAHLEPLSQKLDINEKASHAEIVDAFKKIGIDIKEKTPKESRKKEEKLESQEAKKTPKKKSEKTKPSVKEKKDGK